jgi:hypothetical protein
MSEHLSRFIVGLEVFLLLWPTILAAILIAGVVAPLLSGSFTLENALEALIGLAVGLALVAGTVLAFKFLAGGAAAIRRASELWWGTCGLASVLSLASLLAIWFGGSRGSSSFTALFSFGALYIVPFIHLIIERKFRNEGSVVA